MPFVCCLATQVLAPNRHIKDSSTSKGRFCAYSDHIFSIHPQPHPSSTQQAPAKMLAISAILTTLVATTLAAPISLSLDVSFSYNVLMTAGSAQFAMWVPTNGNAYSSSSLTCLNVGASSEGACNIASIDQVGVASGYTCAFAGSNGWSGAQTGTSSTGWMSVAPPQLISSVACVANS